VNVVGEEAQRHGPHHVLEVDVQGGVRQVEAALIRLDRRFAVDHRLPHEVRVLERAVVVQRLGDLVHVQVPVLADPELDARRPDAECRVHLAAERPAVLGVGDLVEGPLERMQLHLLERAHRLAEERHRFGEPLRREVVVVHEFARAEDGVRELAAGEREEARPDAERSPASGS
jgi:hypothetical protein